MPGLPRNHAHEERGPRARGLPAHAAAMPGRDMAGSPGRAGFQPTPRPCRGATWQGTRARGLPAHGAAMPGRDMAGSPGARASSPRRGHAGARHGGAPGRAGFQPTAARPCRGATWRGPRVRGLPARNGPKARDCSCGLEARAPGRASFVALDLFLRRDGRPGHAGLELRMSCKDESRNSGRSPPESRHRSGGRNARALAQGRLRSAGPD